MSNEISEMETYPRPAPPNPDLRALEPLVGTWRISGEAQGQVRYEWLEAGYFLIQHVELFSEEGTPSRGIEIIGHEQRLFEAPSEEIKSRFYGNDGATFDYVHEMDGDTLTIWAVEKGSPAYYKGTFSADGNTLTGAWYYPNGGGYSTVATRIK